MDAVRVGLIGFGGLAQGIHAPILRGMQRVSVAAVADADATCRQRAASFFPHASIHEDFTDVLAKKEVEAVVIALPTRWHVPAAIAAVQRGKHFYVEKPLGLKAAEGRALLEAWESSSLIGMVGFNQRFHPLHGRLREAIGSGRLGPVRCAQTSFCTPTRPLAAWRLRRADGGGALMELACHHIDLAGWLFDSAVQEVQASIRSTVTEADTVSLLMRLANGVEVQSLFSLSAADVDRWEVFGQNGTMSLDRYRSMAVRFEPAGREFSLKTRLGHWAAAGRGAGLAMRRRRSPGHEPSFGAAMDAFISAVRSGEAQGADVRDGLNVCQVIEAAERSVESGRWEPVAWQDKPAISIQGSSSPMRMQAGGGSSDASGVRLSVILGTPDTYAGLRQTVAALRRQSIVEQIELLIVAPNAQKLGLIEEEVRAFAQWRIVETGLAGSVAHANAAGARVAAAPIVVLGEDHAFPDPHWAQALLARHEQSRYAAVGPVVCNANPATLTSWADLLIGYGPWLESHQGGSVEYLPGHNSSYRRDILLSYGGRLEEMMQAEAVLHWDLRAKGHALYLEPRARLAHTNFGRLGVWLRVQFHAGRMFAATRAMPWSAGRRAVFTCGSPLIPFVRLKRLLGYSRPPASPSIARLLPVLLMGLFMDGVGQMAGYLAGEGGSRHKLSNFEYHRWRFAGPRSSAACQSAACVGQVTRGEH